MPLLIGAMERRKDSTLNLSRDNRVAEGARQRVSFLYLIALVTKPKGQLASLIHANHKRVKRLKLLRVQPALSEQLEHAD
jgi:hypothetical protein